MLFRLPSVYVISAFTQNAGWWFLFSVSFEIFVLIHSRTNIIKHEKMPAEKNVFLSIWIEFSVDSCWPV